MRISQVSLVGEILKAIDKLGSKSCNQRQINAVIEAANLIVAALERGHAPAKPGMGWQAWLNCDDTGLSSRYMLRVMMPDARVPGERNGEHGINYPHDPGDFVRCIGLLDAEPKLRDRMNMLTTGHGPQWAALAANWPELESLYREELPTGKAPKLYERMRQLIELPKEKA